MAQIYLVIKNSDTITLRNKYYKIENKANEFLKILNS